MGPSARFIQTCTASPTNGTSLTGAQHVIGADDFNGDGRSDILLRNTDGTPQMWLMNATSVTASATLAHPAASWHPNTG
jgi:Tol biopolymer transport system component